MAKLFGSGLLRGALALGLFSAAAAVACGGHPGGTVGDWCDDRGSSRECYRDEVCDDIEDGSRYCLLICNDHHDCAGGEHCHGVAGTNLKACHPHFDDHHHDHDDDCFYDEPGCKKKP